MGTGEPQYTTADYDRILDARRKIVERERDPVERTRQLGALPTMDYVSRHMAHLTPEPELLVEHGPLDFDERLKAAQGIADPWDQAAAIGPGPVDTYGDFNPATAHQDALKQWVRQQIAAERRFPLIPVGAMKAEIIRFPLPAVRRNAVLVLVMVLLNALCWQIGLATPLDTNQMQAITLATLVVALLRG